MTTESLTINATDFKARCLEILTRLSSNRLSHVTVTRHGKPVAELYPPRSDRAQVEAMFGAMAGLAVIPVGLDLTAPVIDMDDWSPDALA